MWTRAFVVRLSKKKRKVEGWSLASCALPQYKILSTPVRQDLSTESRSGPTKTSSVSWRLRVRLFSFSDGSATLLCRPSDFAGMVSLRYPGPPLPRALPRTDMFGPFCVVYPTVFPEMPQVPELRSSPGSPLKDGAFFATMPYFLSVFRSPTRISGINKYSMGCKFPSILL